MEDFNINKSQIKTAWYDRCKFPIHMLSCWPRYNKWHLRYKQQPVLTNGPKYREFKSLNWKHNLNIIMDIVKDCAKTRGDKRINLSMRTYGNIYTISKLGEKCEWLILIRNKEKRLNGKIGTWATSLKTAKHLSHLYG